MSKRVYMTLLSRHSYLAGTLVLHHSLMATKPKYPFVVLVTSTLSTEARDILKRSGIEMKEIDLLLLPPDRWDPTKTAARFADIWTKVRVFQLEEYDKVVFLDSDMLVRRNMDEVFDLPITANQVAATHVCACNPRKVPHYPKDWIPANCGYSQANYPACLADPPPTPRPRPHYLLNSGMFLCRPSADLYRRMKKMLDTSPLISTWKFCDQDLIGNFFGGGGSTNEKDWGEVTKEELGDVWMPIPYYYNALKPVRQVHASFWRDEDIRVVHYILGDKPWMDRPPQSDNEPYEEVKRWWWASYDTMLAEMATIDRTHDIAYVEGVCGPREPSPVTLRKLEND